MQPPITNSSQRPEPLSDGNTNLLEIARLLDISLINSAMSQQPSAKLKLPDIMLRNNVVPGPNSWALAATQGDPKKLPQLAPPTNRDKYEQRPMPPIPDKSYHDRNLIVPKHRQYIQPATPLLSLGQKSELKSRAATDPVVPQPLFAGKPDSIAKLGTKVSNPKNYADLVKEDAPVHSLSENELQILGLRPTRDNSRQTPPASAPASTNTPDPYRIPSDDYSAQSMSSSRQIQSTPLPTRRYLRENNLQAPGLGHTSLATTAEALEGQEGELQRSDHPKATMVDHNLSSPTRTGTYDTARGVEYVEEHENQRIASYAGVIENAGSAERTSPIQHSDTSRGQNSGELLPPTVYSPSNYGGVWENDPHVVRKSQVYVRWYINRIIGLLASSIHPVPIKSSSRPRNAKSRLIAGLWSHGSGSFA